MTADFQARCCICGRVIDGERDGFCSARCFANDRARLFFGDIVESAEDDQETVPPEPARR